MLSQQFVVEWFYDLPKAHGDLYNPQSPSTGGLERGGKWGLLRLWQHMRCWACPPLGLASHEHRKRLLPRSLCTPLWQAELIPIRFLR
eukprot:5831399-Amphidinium_carterae.1